MAFIGPYFAWWDIFTYVTIAIEDLSPSKSSIHHLRFSYWTAGPLWSWWAEGSEAPTYSNQTHIFLSNRKFVDVCCPLPKNMATFCCVKMQPHRVNKRIPLWYGQYSKKTHRRLTEFLEVDPNKVGNANPILSSTSHLRDFHPQWNNHHQLHTNMHITGVQASPQNINK